MLKVLTQTAWVAEVEKTRQLFFNERPEITEALCTIYKYQPKYLIFFVKKQPIFTFIAYTSGKKILQPIHFFYSSFWFNSKFSETAYIHALASFIRELKKAYNTINISLPTDIKDIRPFLWEKFSLSNRFTYVKDVNCLRYAKDARQNVASKTKHFLFKKEPLSPEILSLNLAIFYELKTYPKFKIAAIERLLLMLKETPFLHCYSAYDGDKLVASHIIFTDIVHRTAYAVVRNKVSVAYNTSELHSKLYHHLFLSLKEDGFDYIDLLGGNLQNVSLFKARFNADLVPCFNVSYSRSRAVLSNFLTLTKSRAIRIVSKFS